MKILVVVDMQNDFIDGALGTKEAVSIVPHVVEKIRQFDGRVLYTRDTHEEITWRLRREEICRCRIVSGGQKDGNWRPQIEAIRVEKAGEAPLDKPTFGSCELGQLLKAQDDDLKKTGRTGDRVHYVDRFVYGYLCDLQRHDRQSISSGSAGESRCRMLCGSDAGKP